MSALSDLKESILDEKTPLSGILRRAKVLATDLGSKELLGWVDKEMKGYAFDGDTVPSYRVLSTHSIGNFSGPFGSGIRNQPIPTFNLSSKLQEWAGKHVLYDGIKAIESTVENKGDNQLIVQWPPNTVAAVGEKIFQDMVLMEAHKILSSAQLEQVLDTVRNRLLDFVIDLEKTLPKDRTPTPQEIKESAAAIEHSVHTIILGDNNYIVSNASGQQHVPIQKGAVNVANPSSEVSEGKTVNEKGKGVWGTVVGLWQAFFGS
ncbi:MAG TPA: hypothetical protein VGL38_08540 [bacterium]|jgi:hypothetical protein